MPTKKLSAKALAAFAKTGRRGGKIGGKALTIKLSAEERQERARRRVALSLPDDFRDGLQNRKENR
jgi:hypothetical protein